MNFHATSRVRSAATRSLRFAAVAALGALSCMTASTVTVGFELPEFQENPPNSGMFRSGYRWPDPATTVNINVSVPSGEPNWNIAFQEAADRWNAVTPFEFTIGSAATPECVDDEVSVAAFRTNICAGTPIDTDPDPNRTVLAVTLLRFIEDVYASPTANRGGIAELVEVDVLFNDQVDWDVFSGANTGNTQDFRRVATHELGHVIGLAHEDDAGVGAIMRSGVGRTEFPQSDDIKGVEVRYGLGTANTPPAACTNFGSIGVPASTTVTVLGTCAVRDFIAGETSYQPAFRYDLEVTERGLLRIASAASAFGTRVALYDAATGALVSESSGLDGGSATASAGRVVAPGEYFLLVSGQELGADGVIDISTSLTGLGTLVAPIISTLLDD